MLDLDQECPISIKYLEDIINRVHLRYPLIEKYKVSIIIQTLFQIIRTLIMDGKVVSLNGLFHNMKIIYFIKNRQKQTIYHSKIKLSTSKLLK